jgi:hypothetical protein
MHVIDILVLSFVICFSSLLSYRKLAVLSSSGIGNPVENRTHALCNMIWPNMTHTWPDSARVCVVTTLTECFLTRQLRVLCVHRGNSLWLVNIRTGQQKTLLVCLNYVCVYAMLCNRCKLHCEYSFEREILVPWHNDTTYSQGFSFIQMKNMWIEERISNNRRIV